MVINEKGVVQGPYTHNEWMVYGFDALDKFQDVMDEKSDIHWHDIYFRHNDDYYSGKSITLKLAY